MAAVAAGVLVAVVAAGAGLACVPAPAGAGPQDLAAQAAALQSRIVDTAQQLHSLAVETEAAAARLAADTTTLDGAQASLAQDRTALARATVAARTTAVDTYMNADGDGGTLDGLFSDGSTEAVAGQTYEALASDTEAGAIDQYRRDQTVVAQQVAVLDSARQADAATHQTLADEYDGLQATVANEQSMLGQVQQAEAQAQVRAEAVGPPAVVPVSTLVAPDGSMAEDLARLRQCESGGDYQADTGNGYFGAYQFALSTWTGLGYGGLPSQAPPATQDAAAVQLEQRSGWGQWPVCAAMLGLD